MCHKVEGGQEEVGVCYGNLQLCQKSEVRVIRIGASMAQLRRVSKSGVPSRKSHYSTRLRSAATATEKF